jgi:hypothetical protein
MHEVRQRDTHFRVLYKIFLRRVVDLDLLSADADTSKLLGQFAALFAGASFLFTAPLILAGGVLPPIALRTMEHLLIATSMLLVGIFSVLAWESAFPALLDLLILGPLPVRIQTIFAAKLASLLGALGLSVLALNGFTGFVWPLLFVPAGRGWVGDLRSLTAYWSVILAAAIFTFSSALAFQGLLSQALPRQFFLRSAVWIQACAFAALLALYILEPSLESPEALLAPENQHLLSMLPSYWFFGLFQQLNGSMFPGAAPLAQRAWIGLSISMSAACLVIVMGYLRLLRRIVEQPDIAARRGNLSKVLCSATGSSGAVLLFSAITLARSRKHRVLLAFYWGAGAAIVYAIATANITVPESTALSRGTGPTETYLLASLLLVCLGIGALRTLLVLPIAARADWVFRMTEFEKPSAYRRATDRFLLGLALAPVWLLLSVTAFARWPGWRAIAFALALGLFGMVIVRLCTVRHRKIPFACSYLPGGGNVHLVFWGTVLLLLPIAHMLAKGFHRGLGTTVGSLFMVTLLLSALAVLNWWSAVGPEDDEGLVFEEAPAADLLSLGIR